MSSFLMLNLAVYIFTTVLERVNGLVFFFPLGLSLHFVWVVCYAVYEIRRETFRTNFHKYIEGGTE